jgi:hypothetical protein
VQSGFSAFVARQYLDNHRLGDLEPAVRQPVIEQLKYSDALSDPERARELDKKHLTELDQTVVDQLLEDLASQLRTDLATKTMEELPAGTRDQVHQALDEQNYFVDDEKVGWYERRTLAQLPSNLLRGLEQHLGRIRLTELANTPFRELPLEDRDSLSTFFDNARLFPDRAAELRLTQSGKLADLPDDNLEQIVQHLGRQWLVELRDRRPPALPNNDREAVWVYLRGQGYFADEFKEELFAYQKLDEFDAQIYQAVEDALVERLSSELQALPVGNMPPHLQAQVRARLTEADYFVDESRLRQVKEWPMQDLPEDLCQAVEETLGSQLLADLNTVPLTELPADTRAALWRYLDEIGYFIDEKKRNQVLDHRLADLKSDSYRTVVADLAQSLEAEIGNHPVSELDDQLRQGLREALEDQGFFESDEVQAEVMAKPLGSLRREELDGLAAQFGQLQLAAWQDHRFADLPEEEQSAVLAHLQASDWFLDQPRLDQLKAQPLGQLEGDTAQVVLEIVRHEQTERLRQKPIADLDRVQRRAVHQILQQQGLALEESQMRHIRRQRLADLDPDVYLALLRELGEQVVSGWTVTRIQDWDRDQQAHLSAYLGRRILGRIERRVLLFTISRLWIDYLTDIEDLRRGIGLEAYGQRDPLIEYKRRAFELFEELGGNIRRAVVRSLFRQPPEPLAAQ